MATANKQFRSVYVERLSRTAPVTRSDQTYTWQFGTKTDTVKRPMPPDAYSRFVSGTSRSIETRRWTLSRVYGTNLDGGYMYAWHGAVTREGTTPVAKMPSASGMEAEALEKIIRKFASKPTAGFGQIIAEHQQTVSMFHAAAKGVHKARKDLHNDLSRIVAEHAEERRQQGFNYLYSQQVRRRRRKSPGNDVKVREHPMSPAYRRKKQSRRCWERTADKIANAWLVFHFGIMPLIEDLDSVMKVYTNGIQQWDPNDWLRASVTRDAEPKSSYGKTVYTSSRSWRCQWTAQATGFRKTRAVAMVRYAKHRITPAAVVMHELGLSSPIALGWELTRLSFVVDWLIGVGNILRAIERYNLVESFWVQYSSEYRHQVRWRDSGVHLMDERNISRGTPQPVTRMTILTSGRVRTDQSTWHLATGLALLQQTKTAKPFPRHIQDKWDQLTSPTARKSNT